MKIETVRVEDGKDGFKTINKTDFKNHVLYKPVEKSEPKPEPVEKLEVKDEKELVKPVAKKVNKQEAERIIREALAKNAEKK